MIFFYHSYYLSKLVVGMFNLPTSDWYFVDHKYSKINFSWIENKDVVVAT